jgi:hypothetical protein
LYILEYAEPWFSKNLQLLKNALLKICGICNKDTFYFSSIMNAETSKVFIYLEEGEVLGTQL